MLYEDYYNKGSVVKNKLSCRELDWAWRKDKMIEGKPPVANCDCNWFGKGLLQRWETKLAKGEVTLQAMSPIAKSHTKTGGPKVPSAVHGP
jgi:hypothetical protein